MIVEESAKTIGIQAYYPQVKKAFSNILRLLDGQIGKPLMMTKPENKDKDLDDVIKLVLLCSSYYLCAPLLNFWRVAGAIEGFGTLPADSWLSL